MITLKLKSVVPLLLLGFVVFQIFGGAVLDAAAQETTPAVPKPSYKEPEPVQQDVKPGGSILQGGKLATSTLDTLILNNGEASVHGLIFYDGYLWASTRTSPGQIFKIHPGTATTSMSVADSVTLDAGLDNAEDIVAANNYIWSIASEWAGIGQAYLIRVDPSTLAVEETILFIDSSHYLTYAESIKYAHGKLWVGGMNGIAEVDITNPDNPSFDLYDTTWLAEADSAWATALTSDATHLWAVFTQIEIGVGYIGSTFARIDPSDLGNQASYTRKYIPSELFPDDMIYANGYLYTSSENSGLPSLVYRLPPDLLTYSTQLASTSGISFGTFFNPLDPYSFWGSYTSSPGKLIKFDFNMNSLWELDLPNSPSNFDDPSEIAFDDDGNMYVSTFTDPARFVKYTAPDAVTVSIAKSGNNAVLTWNNSDPFVDHFEIWRSTDPYFTPTGTVPYATLTATTGTNTYTDVGAIGDVNNNYFYVVRAFNDFGLLSPFSNRVGEFDFALQTIGASTYNDIALVLDVPSINDAESLASYLGNFIIRVMRYYAPLQAYQIYDVGDPDTNFPLSVGDFVFLITNNTAPAIVTLTGGVPDQGDVSFSLTSGSPAKYNFVSLPFDHGSLTTASAVASDVGAGVLRVLKYYNNFQAFQIYDVGDPDTDFPLILGEPFGLVLTSGAPSNWP